MLVRLIYTSEMAKPLTEGEQDALFKVARNNNRHTGITGILCLTDQTCIQVLEGGRQAVSDLYNKIAADSRNKSVCLLVFEEIETRNFGSWSMGRVNLNRVNRAMILRYFDTTEIAPLSRPVSATKGILDDFIENAVIESRC